MMRRGWTMLELMACMALGLIAGTLLTSALMRFHDVYHRAEDALWTLEGASRCLRDLKQDLRSARRISVVDRGAGLDLRFADGSTRRYRFDAASGDFTSDDGRAYFGALQGVRFEDEDTVIAVELALHRRGPSESPAPVLMTRVHCRGRRP